MKSLRKNSIYLIGFAFIIAALVTVVGSLTGDQDLTEGGIDLMLLLGGGIAGAFGALAGVSRGSNDD